MLHPQDIAVLASIISALGGLYAARAARVSAELARATLEESRMTEKRSALRQLSLSANQVTVEAKRIDGVSRGLKVNYQTLAIFCGASNGSRVQIYCETIDKRISEAMRISEKSKSFIAFQQQLHKGPLEEITSREISVSRDLRDLQHIRDEMEKENCEISGQIAAYREAALTINRTPHAN
jgi:hypothetical protein